MTSPLQISVEPDGTKWMVVLEADDLEALDGFHDRAVADRRADEWRTALQNLGGGLVESGLRYCTVHRAVQSVAITATSCPEAHRYLQSLGDCVFVPLCYRKPT